MEKNSVERDEVWGEEAEDEEVVTEDVEPVEEVIVEDEVVVITPKARVEILEEEAQVVLYDSLKWLSILEKLRKVLKEEMLAKPHLKDVIEDEIKEIEKERKRTLWKLGWALTHLREVPLPEELINQARSALRGPEPQGSSRPWVISDLIRRYGIG